MPQIPAIETAERQYLAVLQELYASASDQSAIKLNRTGTASVWSPGQRILFESSMENWALPTTKRLFWKGVIRELHWMLNGIMNAGILAATGTNIWTPDAYRFAQQRGLIQQETTLETFKELLLADPDKFGDLGHIYGAVWRNAGATGIDQITRAIDLLKRIPRSRQILVTGWDPEKVYEAALPPCHFSFRLYLDQQDRLCITVYQRSADWILGVPFNIASYDLLLKYFCLVTGLQIGHVLMMFDDAHMYLSHLDAARTQLKRSDDLLEVARIKLHPEYVTADLRDLDERAVEVLSYPNHGIITAPLEFR